MRAWPSPSRTGWPGLSVNRVVAQAGVERGTFYVHFDDREAFVDALDARFHERVQDAVARGLRPTHRPAPSVSAAARRPISTCASPSAAIKALSTQGAHGQPR